MYNIRFAELGFPEYLDIEGADSDGRLISQNLELRDVSRHKEQTATQPHQERHRPPHGHSRVSMNFLNVPLHLYVYQIEDNVANPLVCPSNLLYEENILKIYLIHKHVRIVYM